MGREGDDAGQREVEPADLQLLERALVVGDLARMEHLHAVAAVGVLRHALGEELAALLARPAACRCG
jgi:hypothetical protein